MAKRTNRTGKGKRKQPELRTGGGRAAKAARSRAREAAVTRNAHAGPAVRMRPAGPLGFAWMLLLAWAVVALVAYLALRFDRWNQLSYPDSAWLFVAIGALVVAPAAGRLSRSTTDTDAWALQALLVPGGLLAAEVLLGPACPNGGRCETIGARGTFGLVGSIVVVALLALLTWGLTRWQYRSAAARRPVHGRVRYHLVLTTMVGMLVFPGMLLAAAGIGADMLVRDTPSLVSEAADEVAQECFDLDASPDLLVRAAPAGYNPAWATFAVRNDDERRPGIGKKGLPDDWANLDVVYPYEATVSFNADGDVVSITCRKVSPTAGNAVADDLQQGELDSNPLSNKTIGSQFLPRFFTQGEAGPSEAAKQAAAADAKKQASKKKKK